MKNYAEMEGITGFDRADKLVRQVKYIGLRIAKRDIIEVVPGGEATRSGLATALILVPVGSGRKLGVPGGSESAGRVLLRDG